MSAPNPFDQFDAAPAQAQDAPVANVFDQFDSQGVSQANPTAPAKSALPTIQKPSVGKRILQGIMAPIGAFDQLATGAIAQPISGLAGLADIPLHALGITDTSPADTVTNVQNALTYRPNNPYAQQMMRDISYLPGKVASAADYAGGQLSNALGGGTFGNVSGAGLSTAIQALPMLLGAKMPGGVEAPELPNLANVAIKNTPAAEAHTAGALLVPSEAGSNPVLTSIEGLTNSSRLKASASAINQTKFTDRLVHMDLEDMGLPANAKMLPQTLKGLRETQGAPYEEIKKLGDIKTDANYLDDVSPASLSDVPGTSFPKAKNAKIAELSDQYSVPQFSSSDAVQQIKQLRKLGQANLKTASTYTSENSPLLGELGKAQLKVADAIENQIDRHLQRGPQSSIQLEPAQASGVWTSGGKPIAYDFKSPQGENIGGLEGSLKDDGKTFHIDDIWGPKGINAPASANANTLGAGAMRDILRQLKVNHPSLESVEGLRTTGARGAPTNLSIEIPNMPKNNLLQRFRQARQNIAKIHSIEDALIGDTGHISAPQLVKQYERGVPLSGNTLTVAKVARDFPHVTKEYEKINNLQPVGALRAMFGGGELLGGIATGHPGIGAAVGATTLFAPPIIRRGLLSSAVQNRLADVVNGYLKPQGLLPQSMQNAARGAAVTSLLQSASHP